jgi:uncharacterized protein (TIGR02145 family)
MKQYNPDFLELGGKKYKTAKINNQLWMAENLSLLVKDSWFYNDDAQNGNPFGMLYTWQAAMDACPDGWKLPTLDDWDNLINTLGGEVKAYRKLLMGGESGFNACFGGYRSVTGSFLSIERAADYWTASEVGDANAWLYYLIYKKEKTFKIIDDKRCGYSVRYIKEL